MSELIVSTYKKMINAFISFNEKRNVIYFTQDGRFNELVMLDCFNGRTLKTELFIISYLNKNNKDIFE